MIIHEEGCAGDKCTCSHKDTADVIDLIPRLDLITPADILNDMLEQDLDSCLVIGYKGEDLYIRCTPTDKDVITDALEKILQL